MMNFIFTFRRFIKILNPDSDASTSSKQEISITSHLQALHLSIAQGQVLRF